MMLYPVNIPYLFTEDLYANRALTTIGLAHPWEQYSESDHQLLLRIVQSVRLTMAHVRIIHGWKPGEDVSRAILFGVELNEPVEPYQACTLHGIPLILADDLSTLTDQKKKLLWSQLKTLFGV